MVACTGFLNEKIMYDTKLAGFDIAIQSPLSVEKIESCIKERLKARINKYDRRID